MGATDLAALYRSGEVSPVEATAAVMTRLGEVNGVLNAVVTLDEAGAAASARHSAERWRKGERLSALDGVPVTIKDNILVGGMRATWGSRLHADFVPEADEAAVARLRAAGAVIIGKTNVPEFTLQGYTDNPLFGPTFNPVAPHRTPGGSSGGGAAAVAAGIGPLAIGTDGGGSIRRPAAHCGLFGFKPSIGQIARYGGFPQIISDLEVIGLLTRTLGDMRAAFGVLRGHDRRDPRSLATLREPPHCPPPWRIGFFPTIGDAPVDPLIAAEVATFARRLEQRGCIVEPIAAPFDIEASAVAWGVVSSSGLAWHVSRLPDWERFVTPNTLALALAGKMRSATDYADALATVARLRLATAEVFATWDLLLCPCTAALAWLAGEPFPREIAGREAGPRGHAVFTGWMNVAGLPALSIPVATTPEDGGIGVQLVAETGRDVELLRIAASLLAN
jgi:aspartyl-tRNA(Asn)/glutamyl-tRNA(Gln) amidotransferase subunit A